MTSRRLVILSEAKDLVPWQAAMRSFAYAQDDSYAPR
jgi:hypothetical protein